MIFLQLFDCIFAYAAISVIEPLFGWVPFLRPVSIFVVITFYSIYANYFTTDYTAGSSSHTWRFTEDWYKTYRDPGTIWYEKEYTVPQMGNPTAKDNGNPFTDSSNDNAYLNIVTYVFTAVAVVLFLVVMIARCKALLN